MTLLACTFISFLACTFISIRLKLVNKEGLIKLKLSVDLRCWQTVMTVTSYQKLVAEILLKERSVDEIPSLDLETSLLGQLLVSKKLTDPGMTVRSAAEGAI